MTPEHERTIPFFLGAVFQSLARPVELAFINGSVAFGLFAGIDHTTGKILVKNFCLAHSEELEADKKIDLASLRYFVVREPPADPNTPTKSDIHNSPLPKRQGLSGADKWKPKQVNGTGAAPSETRPPGDRPRGIKNDEFRTDTEISKRTAEGRVGVGQATPTGTKVFKRFSTDNTFKEELLDSKGTCIGDWDQFRANKEVFGINSQFDENDYTTHLDLKKASKAEIERAERLAKEIEGTTVEEVAHTRHWQEERGLLKLRDNDEDEEALYSAVVREVPMDQEETPKSHPTGAFLVRKTDPEKLKGFRETVAKNYRASKLQGKEAVGMHSVRGNLANPVGPHSQTAPGAQGEYFGMPPGFVQPMVVAQPGMQVGYPQGFGYFPQGMYYQYGFPQQMFPQQQFYQPPKPQ